jgi:NAD(P)-dependent dehydrogenase (short-subunit alcohol dehydrogenase family)
MTRGILLAGNESSLLSALGAEAAKRVKSCAAALIPHGSGGGPDVERQPESGRLAENRKQRESEENPVVYLDWNPASPVSARTLVLAARSRLEHIDDAVLVCVPPAYRRPPEELAPAEIDRLIDCNIKGWFFLVRELTGVFKKRALERKETGGPGETAGTLTLVLKDLSAARDDLPDLAGPVIAAAFKSFVQGLLISTANAPYTVTAFSSQEAGEEAAFAAYIFKTIEGEKRNAGKWYKYGKAGFFGR